jgi:hypothetical protein
MLSFSDISVDTFAAHWQKHNLSEGVIAMLAIGVALLGGALSGHEAAGAIAAGGAFTVGFAVFYPVLQSPILSMAICTLSMATATFAGSLSAEWTFAVMMVVAIAGLNYGLLSGLGVSAGWIGQQSAVYLVIATYFPNGPRLAAGRATMILLGGLLQIVIHLAFRRRLLPRHGAPLWKITLARARNYSRRLHEHMAWGHETLNYATRLLFTMVVATAIYRTMHLRNGYWVPMTALLVLKPQWTGTISRSLARVIGTFSGALVAYGFAQWHHWPHAVLGIMVVLFALGCYALQAVNYALFSLSITLYIVFLFRFGGFSETAAAHLRLLNTAIGGVLALVIDSIWQGIAVTAAKLRAKHGQNFVQ